jgi:hypothetical protein
MAATVDWAAIRAKLPVGRDEASNKKRDELFKQFDPNSNHLLSLAEVDRGVRDVLQTESMFDAKECIMMAFKGAKALNPKASHNQDFVDRKEFRMLLVYLENYFKVWEVFTSADAGRDHRLTKEEFLQLVPQLSQWCGAVSGEELWAKLSNGGHHVLFHEFADFAIKGELAKDAVDAI